MHALRARTLLHIAPMEIGLQFQLQMLRQLRPVASLPRSSAVRLKPPLVLQSVDVRYAIQI